MRARPPCRPYIVLLIMLGVMTIRKGHRVILIVDDFVPLFLIIGALMPARQG